MGRVTRFLQATSQTTAEPARDAQQAADQPELGLQRVVSSWPTLPKHVQRAILTLVRNSKPAPVE